MCVLGRRVRTFLQLGLGIRIKDSRGDVRRCTRWLSRHVRVAHICAVCVCVLAVLGLSSSSLGAVSRWTYRRVPLPSGQGSAVLTAISCSSTTACTAVGGGFQSAIDRWNGVRWSPEQAPQFLSTLVAVSCPSRFSCVAVGSSGQGSGLVEPLLEHWDGSHWSVQTTPQLGGGFFTAVSCGSTRSCIAVGRYRDGSFVLHWNGRRWAAQPLPRRGQPSLQGVSCWSSRSCVMVGSRRIGAGACGGSAQPLIERWNGARWSIQHTCAGAALTSVSCASKRRCMAIGESGFAEWWNGRTWTVRDLPNISNWPEASCDARTCAAVKGDSGNGPPLWQWNGSKWSRPPSRFQPSPEGPFLKGISCPSVTVCFAVGYKIHGRQRLAAPIVARGP